MFAAYVLIQLNAPDPRKVIKGIRRVAGVKQAHVVVGPTDCIAFVEAPEPEALGDIIVAIRGVKGVASTDTRMAMTGI
jgi:DNA-binding Lrp family transcriptional regulator